jgi:hypothetical protein
MTDNRTANEVAAQALEDARNDPRRAQGSILGSADEDKRAEQRGTYRTPDGRLRVVAAGDPIPTGWTQVEQGEVEDRAEATITARDEPGTEGANRTGRKRQQPAENK